MDGQGTALGDDVLETKPTVSNHSLACQQRCEDIKKKAWEAAASKQVLDGSMIMDDKPLQEESIVEKDMNLSEVLHQVDVIEEQLEGCTVIEPVQEEVLPHPDMAQKQKANMFYNMRQCCQQKLTKHTNKEIKSTDTAKFHQSSIVHVIMPEELDSLMRTKGLQVIHLSQPT